jgi:hypothetical protein
VATVFTVLFLAGLVPVTPLVGDTHFPSPFATPDAMVAYFRQHSARVALCAFFQFAAAIPLGIYVATMTSRLRFLGVRAAGVDIALFGGFAAAFMTLVSALTQWTLARPGIAADGTLVQVVMGLVLAVVGELSALSLIVPRALFLIPLTRFPGFIWLIAAGFALAGHRAPAAR